MTLTAEDHKIRKGRITSTRAANIVLDERTHGVWLSATGRADDVEVTEPMLIGTHLEDGIARVFEHKMGVRVLKPPTIVHPDPRYNFAADSTDGLIYPHDDAAAVDWSKVAYSPLQEPRPAANLEIKARGFAMAQEYGEEGSDEVPERDYIQACWHMWVHGLPACYVVPLLGGHVLSVPIYRIKRDRDFEGAIIYKCEQFYHDYIQPDKEPPLDGWDDTCDYIKKKYKSAIGEIVDASQDVSQWAEDLDLVRQDIKRLDEKKKSLENRIKNYIGDNAGARGEDFVARWSNVKGRLDVNWQAIAMQAGADEALIKQHTRIKNGYRRFSVKRNKVAS